MERSHLQLRRADARGRIGIGAAAKSPAHPRERKKAHPQGSKRRWEGASHPREPRRIQQQQALHVLRPAPGELQGHGPSHGGSNDANRRRETIQEGFEMGHHTSGAIGTAGWSRGEAKPIEIRNQQGEGTGEQRSKATKLQKRTVEAVQQKYRWPLTGHGDRPLKGG
jgi:hypothetical protein